MSLELELLDLDALEYDIEIEDMTSGSTHDLSSNFEYDSDSSYSVYINKGTRRTQQDRFYANPHIGQYGVFDGHGESSVPVDFVSEQVFPQLQKMRDQNPDQPYSELMKSTLVFESLDQQLMRICSSEKERNSGSVALLAEIHKNSVNLTSLGDCVAIVIKKNGSLQQLNQTQTAQNEMRFIEQRGGWVLKAGNVYRTQGMLAVSRSFGNFNLKNIISCEPIVSLYNIQPDDLAIVMATDGLWNELSFEAVADIVTKGINTNINLSRMIFEAIPQSRSSLDNVTIIAIKL